MSTASKSATALLVRWRQGDRAALDALIPIVYAELHRVARARLRTERDRRGLQTTALVHEAYLRLVDLDHIRVENRTHFFALAARVMRQVLVDHARRHRAAKRGGGATTLALEEVSPAATPDLIDVIALDAALEALARVDQRLCRVVELRFFAGLNIDETAAALKISTATIERDWAVAKAWLYDRLARTPTDAGSRHDDR